MIPQQYPVRLVVGKNFFNSGKNGARQDVSFNCLAHWPTYKKTTPMLCHKMFRQRLQLRSAEGKQGKKTSSPPEIHLTVLFVHEVLKQTGHMSYGQNLVHGERTLSVLQWRHLGQGIVWGIVLGWAPIGFAVMATPRPSQYYFGHT